MDVEWKLFFCAAIEQRVEEKEEEKERLGRSEMTITCPRVITKRDGDDDDDCREENRACKTGSRILRTSTTITLHHEPCILYPAVIVEIGIVRALVYGRNSSIVCSGYERCHT